MRGCDYSPAVRKSARMYTRNPRRFAASWKRAMPFLLLTVDELGKRDLPGEFAMLPYVESTYQPLPSRGDHSAGMWQLTPETARAVGVIVDADYDGRLDALASTNAALDLIARYQREFGDWRLADMAYNGGEYRVRKLLDGRDAHALTPQQLAKLPFNPTTHQHLDRLLALACIIDDPQRFGVTLPEPEADDRLLAVPLQAGMDLRLAARLAGLDVGDVARWNAGYRHHRMPDDAPHRLLLPATHVNEFLSAADTVPVALWSDWREQRVARTGRIDGWATQAGIPVAVLASANAVDDQATITASTQLLLPGREPESESTDEPGAGSARHATTHIVVAGDTLSGIAHHYAIALHKLKRWNPHAGRVLHPGERLRVGD
jgi:membrane-bound lytic murein transglycosylase D